MLYLDQRPDTPFESAAPSASSLLVRNGARSEVDSVYAEIFDAIMDRRLPPGAKLTEAALCKVFSCSRATVRAALAQLAHDKIVMQQPHRGAFVWQADAKETRDIFEMRRATECLIIQKLLDLPDLPGRLAPLYEMVQSERHAFEQGDRVSWIRLSNAFHVKMAHLADNHVMSELMHSLCSRTTLIIALHDTPTAGTCSYIEHRRILDLLIAGDREGVMTAMSHHLNDCEHRMQEPRPDHVDPWAVFSIKR